MLNIDGLTFRRPGDSVLLRRWRDMSTDVPNYTKEMMTFHRLSLGLSHRVVFFFFCPHFVVVTAAFVWKKAKDKKKKVVEEQKTNVMLFRGADKKCFYKYTLKWQHGFQSL